MVITHLSCLSSTTDLQVLPGSTSWGSTITITITTCVPQTIVSRQSRPGSTFMSCVLVFGDEWVRDWQRTCEGCGSLGHPPHLPLGLPFNTSHSTAGRHSQYKIGLDAASLLEWSLDCANLNCIYFSKGKSSKKREQLLLSVCTCKPKMVKIFFFAFGGNYAICNLGSLVSFFRMSKTVFCTYDR